MSRWPMVSLGELLRRSNETAILDFDTEYHEVTIRLWGKGVISRGKVKGNDVGTSRQVVRANQLILSKIDARNGAIGIVPPELDGAIVSNDFPSFEFAEKLDSSFMGWLVRSTPFVELCKAASEGTTNRVRIKEDRFLTQQIQLPSLEKQQTIVARLDQLADKVRQVNEHLDATETDAEALIRNYIFSPSGKGITKRKMSELVSLRQPDVAVDQLENYQFAGVYSFGRGVFASVNKAGSEFAYPRLSTVKTGDFIYPKLMAWEGALGVVPEACDGMVVSPEFPVFTIDTDAVLPEIIDIYFRTPSVWPELAGISGGTNVRRRRLQPSVFLNYEMPVPPMSTQLKIREMHQRVQQLKTSHKAIREANQALIPATLERLFSNATGEHKTKCN
ncbi:MULTISPECIES: restriction endonuclease subunit S [Methylomonas]|uniref:Restriction endonuclease subunit S n=2 Tax=Methylomonas TaxID=416 RepID=A0A140E7I5_9GAMM|nr:MULTISPECIES: restriction endonuclease subunit S [Methylomonas]AMK79359.1 restriction endonuclease subunit S [Methylomonas denitrificans]OAI03217.1 restriction endonuclease subunit S [Methylomonas methanica]TCV86119.1 type I restriction enzyme S subunit [Methylomonas methanica]